MHPKAIFVVDEDATQELKVKTVKYHKALGDLHSQLASDWKYKSLSCIKIGDQKVTSADALARKQTTGKARCSAICYIQQILSMQVTSSTVNFHTSNHLWSTQIHSQIHTHAQQT